MNQLDSDALNEALTAVGEVLAERGHTARVLVVGGAAQILRGLTDRLTVDVDVLALDYDGTLANPDPLPPHLQAAVDLVARNYGYDTDWLNGKVAVFFGDGWPDGLPPDVLADVEWREFGGLSIGLAGTPVLIALKLYAVANAVAHNDPDARDRPETSGDADVQRHWRDLVRLEPTDDDLTRSLTWLAGFPEGSQLSLAAAADAARRAR